jgi:hypothetical protein
LYDVKIDIGSKRKLAALDGVRRAKTKLNQDGGKMTAACRDAKVCQDIIQKMISELDPLEKALRDSTNYSMGSEQEREALDKSYASQSILAKQLTELEENMVPAEYEVPVPSEYNDLPQLKGRATVVMTLKKPDGAPFNVNGENFKEAKMTMVIDGYNGKL